MRAGEHAPPQDLDAERSMLGVMIVNPAAIAVASAVVVRVDDFYHETNGLVFRAICGLCDADVPVDPVTLGAELERRGELERVGGKPYIHSLVEMVPAATSVRRYAEIVSDRASRRALLRQSDELRELAERDDRPADDLWQEAEQLAAAGAEEATPEARTETAFVDWSALWQSDRDEAEWTFDDVLARGRGHSLYASQKQGKSLFMLSVAARLATGAEPVVVVYLDYEMTEADVRERLSDMGYGPHTDLSRLRYCLLPTLPPLDRAPGGAALARIVDATQASFPNHHLVVVIDTIGRAVAGEEDPADTWRDFYRHSGIELKRRGVTWVRLDHAGKNPESGQRGSSSKGDDVDVVWRLTRTNAGICLHRDCARMGWVPERVTFVITEDPLAFRRRTDDYPERTAECANILDRLEVPLGASRRDAEARLKAIGEGFRHEVVAAALRFRRDRLEAARS